MPFDQPTGAPLIETKALSKRFGDNTVLRDVSMGVASGEVVCVIGPSGSGKTTLLRSMALLEAPSGGQVLMDGTVIADGENGRAVRKAARAVRSDIGMVFQHFNLWPHMSVLGNVIEAPMRVRGLGRDQAVAEAEALLEKVGLAEKRDASPGRLSGGQQQRVAIARALAMKPRLMLFDEATSALDPELKAEVLAVMRALAEEGMTMLAVTHEMNFARRACTRLVFMDGGEIVEEGAPAAFFDAPTTERARRFLARLED
ncbi:polar amino acid transport system ATP-binding protein [Albimonas donghaensis]|uniref:Polar amino acid transport system ATP-binding protein n=1 Tax=Albimonas donghaensis TaxID=356660 RepID=A0A1H3DM21_9RHOB|nr:amino acid ABC transporter ATP-binding protein [Albimonas donghaensis]SDX66714.1 polar amino acid transport system ATP-binding protein [Albimonas donghaensis]